MKFVLDSIGPGSLVVVVGKSEVGKPTYVQVQGTGVSANTRLQCIAKEGQHDCKTVVLGVREAFKTKGAYEPQGVLELVPWTPKEIAEYYAAKAKEYAG